MRSSPLQTKQSQLFLSSRGGRVCRISDRSSWNCSSWPRSPSECLVPDFWAPDESFWDSSAQRSRPFGEGDESSQSLDLVPNLRLLRAGGGSAVHTRDCRNANIPKAPRFETQEKKDGMETLPKGPQSTAHLELPAPCAGFEEG